MGTVTAYRRRVTACVTWARHDAAYRRYIDAGWNLAATTRLADHWGTWVAHDARRAMGHID